MTTHNMTPTEALAFFHAQGPKQPGTEGFWQVWGASPQDLKAGDILISKGADGAQADYIVFTERGSSLVRQNFTNQDGEKLSVGLLSPVIICRWGVHGTLSDSVR